MRIAESVDLVQIEDEDHDESAQSPLKYLDLLQTLFLAYVFGGMAKVETAPTSESRNSDPLHFVEVPWDVLIRVHHRATVQVWKVPYSMQLAWLETRMEGEREAWIEELRNSDETLGQVIANVYTSREAVWAVVELKFTSQNMQSPVRKIQDKGEQGGSGKKRAQDPPESKSRAPEPAANTASSLRDGNKLCANYNRGSCGNKKETCKHGRLSAVVLRQMGECVEAGT